MGAWGECNGFSWLTVTTLERERGQTLYRIVSTYFNFFYNSTVLVVIALIVNYYPDNIYIWPHDYYWTDLYIVQNTFLLNAYVSGTIVIGILSIFLDRLYGWCGSDMVFHDCRRFEKEYQNTKNRNDTEEKIALKINVKPGESKVVGTGMVFLL